MMWDGIGSRQMTTRQRRWPGNGGLEVQETWKFVYLRGGGN